MFPVKRSRNTDEDCEVTRHGQNQNREGETGNIKRLCVGVSSLPIGNSVFTNASVQQNGNMCSPWPCQPQQENVPPGTSTDMLMETDFSHPWNSPNCQQPHKNFSVPQVVPQAPRRCLRCLSGEPGHINHILG